MGEEVVVIWFKVLAFHLPGCTEENYETPHQDKQSVGHDTNIGSEHESRLLTI